MPAIALPGTVQQAASGASGFDIDSVVSAAMAQNFVNDGYSFCIRYVPRTADPRLAPGNLTNAEAADILNAGLALMAVQHVEDEGWSPTAALGTSYGSYAATYASEIVGLPQGMNIWLDLEGVATTTAASDVIAYCQAWYTEVNAAGYVPGIYIGWQVIINNDEAYNDLSFQHYWSAYNADVVVATRGYQLVQSELHGPNPYGIDVDTTQNDNLGGTVLWLAV
jgi:hypothetical protein